MKKKKLDIIIPVFNEGKSILKTIEKINKIVSTDHNIFICFDDFKDNTLVVIKKKYPKQKNIFFVKNKSFGAHGAVMTGIKRSKSNYVLVIPADDDYNQKIIDKMILKSEKYNADVVCPCRFTKNSKIINGPFFKFLLVKFVNYSLFYFANIPSKDSTNGFRLFSRKVIENINIVSEEGFTYSIEYLLKSYEKNYTCLDFSADWKERKFGKSRFKIIGWSTSYLKWYFYAWRIFINKLIKKN